MADNKLYGVLGVSRNANDSEIRRVGVESSFSCEVYPHVKKIVTSTIVTCMVHPIVLNIILK